MPITQTDIIDGPNPQRGGAQRGTIRLTFDDGRAFERRINAIDAIEWSSKVLNIVAEQEAKVALDGAKEASKEDAEIATVKEASREQVALAFLRTAMEIGEPYLAYLKLNRFNDYRLDKGWSLNQVVAGLASVGLTEEEWVDMKARFQYLSNASRVTAMQDYNVVLAGDIWGEANR